MMVMHMAVTSPKADVAPSGRALVHMQAAAHNMSAHDEFSLGPQSGDDRTGRYSTDDRTGRSLSGWDVEQGGTLSGSRRSLYGWDVVHVMLVKPTGHNMWDVWETTALNNLSLGPQPERKDSTRKKVELSLGP